MLKVRHLFRTAVQLERCSCSFSTSTCAKYAASKNEPLHQGGTFIPRRAVLYVPGNEEKKLMKVPNMDVDCVVMDCEDGVAINRKEEARTTICKMLDELNFGRTEAVVRVNSVASGLAEEDLRVTMSAKNLPPTLMLPKVEAPSELDWFSDKLLKVFAESEKKPKFNLVIFVESALGLLNLRDICRRGKELSHLGPINLDGIVFGSDDYVADIGATRTSDGKELLYARQKIVVTAKAFRLQAIDMVHIDFKDLDGLRQYALEGARMGFSGKQVIHPSQVSVVQEAFSPTPEKVRWATDCVKAFYEHQNSGKGAFIFEGNMIDMPSLLQAKNILKIAEVIQQNLK